jgi:toxin ParE1/3/4
MKIVRTRRANGDLLRIHQYVATHNPAAAEALARKVDRIFRQLAEHPFSGVEREDLGPELRSRFTPPFVIVYQVRRDAIFIVRVMDSRMDIEAEFRR